MANKPSYFIPRHLRQPGEDGYRTPTVEDSMSQHSSPHHRRPSHFPFHGSSTHAALHASSRLTPFRSEEKGQQQADLCRLPEDWPNAMNWKQRIKHFTWAYFTLTMATGGIANVLHTGMWENELDRYVTD